MIVSKVVGKSQNGIVYSSFAFLCICFFVSSICLFSVAREFHWGGFIHHSCHIFTQGKMLSARFVKSVVPVLK